MNVNVFVFDDDKCAIDKMRERLALYSDITIYEFQSLADFLNKKAEIPKPDIAFIDIQFGKDTGFDVIKCLGEINSHCLFVFVTNYTAYLKQGYEYRIYRYILKEEPDALIMKQIDDTFQEFYKNNKILHIKTEDNDATVKSSDIKYISIVNHTCALHTVNGDIYYSNQSLNKLLEDELDNAFVRCHKGYAVNLNYVRGFQGRNKVVLSESELLEIGRAYKKELVMKYEQFIKSKL